MKCPFQWTEADTKFFSDSTPIRTRRFIDCEEHRCPAYIPEDTIKVGNLECYVKESCKMFQKDHNEQKG